MDEEVSASFWISFFVEAGIPPAAAANYAIVFTDNRIQKHMLLDLTKEYLKDMGITVLGDIIAILKHSKLYHEKVAREKVLATDRQLSVQKATKHLNELLIKDDKVVQTPPTIRKTVPQPTENAVKVAPQKKIKLVKVETDDNTVDNEPEEREDVKRKTPIKTQVKTVNAAKVVKKTSVFERLGDSSVTSTTTETPDSSVKNSVFRRLGDKTAKETQDKPKEPIKITAGAHSTRILINKSSIVTKPAGTLTDTSETKQLTMRMDLESATSKQSARHRLGITKTISLMKPIGIPPITVTSDTRTTQPTAQKRLVKLPLNRTQSTKASTLVTRSKPITVTVQAKTAHSGVKQRLGLQAAKTTTVNKSVFSRLGQN